MQILTYNFVSIPEFKHSQIITYKGQNVCSQKGLAYPLSDLIMLNHYDPDPSLGLIHHQTLRYILSSNKEKHQKPITCIFSFDLTLHKILNTCTIIPSIFSSLYTQILCQYLGPKPLRANTLDQISRIKMLAFQHVHTFHLVGVCIRIRSFSSVDQHVYVVLTKWAYVCFLNYFTSTFSLTFFILISRPQFHVLVILYQCPITSEQTCYTVIFHITSEMIPLNYSTFCHIYKHNYHAFYHILYLSYKFIQLLRFIWLPYTGELLCQRFRGFSD